MQGAEELGKAKRTRKRSTSAGEPPKKSVKGSDYHVPYAGEDSQAAAKLNSWFGTLRARLKVRAVAAEVSVVILQ